MNRFVLMLVPLAALAVMLAVPRSTEAGLQPNEDFEYFVDSGPQRGLLFWDNNRQEMVIQPGWTINTINVGEDEFTSDGNLKDFTSFAWLLPLPSLPDSYTEVEPEVFDDIAKFTEVESRLPAASDARDNEADTGPIVGTRESDEIEFLEALEVGEYEIQPIKANGEAGREELEDWLDDNDFGEADERVLRYYIEKEFYWLAIKLDAEDGLPPDGQVKPLHVSFKSAYPVYPLKINDKKGAFDLELWVITREAVDLVKSRRFGIRTSGQIDEQLVQRNREPSYINLPESVRTIADGSDDLKELRIGKVFVYRFAARGLDAEDGVDLGLLQDELHFQFERSVAEKPEEEVNPEGDEEADEEEGEDGGEPEEDSTDS